jgi:hypothetical protein
MKKITNFKTRTGRKFSTPIIAFCFLLFCFLPFGLMAQFSGGDGSEATPYIITTPAQLAQLATYVNAGNANYNGKHYKLNNNLDLSDYNSGEGWIPIGGASYGATFNGVFNGNDHTISGLYINNTTFNYVGLFGRTYIGSMVKNIRITGMVVNSLNENNNDRGLGGVVGDNCGGSVLNCYVSGSLNSQKPGTYSGYIHVGGIVGKCSNPGNSISHCGSSASVTCTGNYGFGNVGGIVGTIEHGGQIDNCYSTGAISSSSGSIPNVGGIVGQLSCGVSNASISNCYATGIITAIGGNSIYSANAGGIAGLISQAGGVTITLNNCAGLNKQIICIGTSSSYYARVLGRSGAGYFTMSQNIGFNNMLKTDGTTEWGYTGHYSSNGEDITAQTINTDGTLGGRFTAANGWTIVNGKLPGLFGTPVDMPEHLLPSSGDAPVITTTSLPNGTISVAYSQTLQATGDTPITWIVESGNLPNGLSLSASGIISGIPTTLGTFNFTVKATNGTGSDTKALAIAITKAPQTPPDAPMLASKTSTSITLNTITGCEYRKDDGAWQTSPVFSGLAPKTTYWFDARKIETETHLPSDPGPKAYFTTNEAQGDIYTITATVNNSDWGTITPAGECTVEEGESITFTITPTAIGEIEDVKVNGVSKGAISTYTFENVQANGTIEVVFKNKVGIATITNDELQITVYPNPTTGQLTINNEQLTINNVEIFDFYGKNILSQTINRTPQTTVDISHLPSGIYFLQIHTEKGTVNKKVVKQ